jgi:hypothetical protein
MLPLDHMELAWAAGFFDGEGHISYHETVRRRRGNTYHSRALVFMVVQTGKPGDEPPHVLTRFQNAVGGLGVVEGPIRWKNMPAHWTSRWQFRPNNWTETQAMIAMLWRWLSPIKRTQARDSLLAARAWHDRRGVQSLPLYAKTPNGGHAS